MTSSVCNKTDLLPSLINDDSTDPEFNVLSSDEEQPNTFRLVEEGASKLGRGDISSSPSSNLTRSPDSNNLKFRVVKRVKCAVISVMVTVAIAFATIGFIVGRQDEVELLKRSFNQDVKSICDAFYDRVNYKIWAARTVAATVKVNGEGFNSDVTLWPNVTVPDFYQQTIGQIHSALVDSIFWGPIIKDRKQLDSWEVYAIENQGIAGISNPTEPNRTIEDGIFRFDDSWELVDDKTIPSIPIWQTSPPEEKRQLSMLDLFSIDSLKAAISISMNRTISLFGDILDDEVASLFLGKGGKPVGPRTVLITPVQNANPSITGESSGIVGLEVAWISFFQNILTFERDVAVVLQSTCDKASTYIIRGERASYLGPGDLHDREDDGWACEGSCRTSVKGFVKNWFDHDDLIQLSSDMKNDTEIKILEDQGVCMYWVEIYLTDDYKNEFCTFKPYLRVMIVSLGCFLMILMFIVYDVLVERRNRQVVDSAARSNAIINSLFPAVIRARLFGNPAIAKETEVHGENDSASIPKTRLLNFLSKTIDYSPIEDEPIAEMFSSTTIIFADIAGFTSWSSEREPSMVFTLLETLYSTFDGIAKSHNVFKVETIGDCYVAVTGLPEPDENHAIACAKFAREILHATKYVTQELELTLGPGTSDLGLRIGLHSGTVTAGVLRGDKSRFQLFGDTMNTASRMESTGKAGKIQISEETANILKENEVMKDILVKRNDTVNAKGKGAMQTYWIKELSEEIDNDDATTVKSSIGRESNSVIDTTKSLVVPAIIDDSNFCSLAKSDRLVDWVADVLMKYLVKLEQHRRRFQLDACFGQEESKENQGTLVIDEVVEVISLPKFKPNGGNKIRRVPIKAVRAQLKEFVTQIALLYRGVPFHNFEHAAHVTLSANKLMKRITATMGSTFGISDDPLAQFAVVFAALIHDVDHTGLPNTVLVRKGTDIAKMYQNRSVAEQNSVVVAWDLLLEPRFGDLQSCIFHGDSGKLHFRQLLVNTVMATDIMDRGVVEWRKVRWEKAFHSEPSQHTERARYEVTNRKATIVLEYIIQASDVAHTMQHWHTFIRWNTRLYNEIYKAYANGDIDADPTNHWYETQISFFDDYVIPLAMKLRECGVFGVSGDEYLTYAQLNRTEWEQKGREETALMVQQRDRKLQPEEAISTSAKTAQKKPA